METENRTVFEVLQEIRSLQKLLMELSEKERACAEKDSGDSFLYGLDKGYASAYEVSARYLEDIIKNKP